MKLWRNEEGQALVVSALTITSLFGFVAMATDVGLLFRAKRNVQIAADAAATAAAIDAKYGLSASAAALAAAARNGVTNGVGGATVTVNTPPVYGPNAGSSNYVEVIVNQPNPTFFMKMFNIGSANIEARAVAGLPNPGTGCVYIMNPSSSASLKLQGAFDIQAAGCGVYVNSNSSSAISVTGNGGIVNAAYLETVGGISGSTSPTSATTGVTPLNDPFNNLEGPTPTSGCPGNTSSATSVTGTVNNSGVICYTSGVTLNGATLNNGVYVFENGVTISGTVNVNNGTLDIYSGTFNQPSNTVLNVTAPTSGTYNGLAIMQPASNSNELQVQFGSNNQTMDGMLYAPGAEVYLQDNGGGVTYTGIIADTMFIKSSSVTISSYNLQHPTTTPLRVVTLVE